MQKKQIKFKMNALQEAVFRSTAKHKNVVAGRGAGKNTGIQAPYIHNLVTNLPRGKFGLQGVSYKDLMTTALPSMLNGLHQMGYRHKVDYYYGRRPPAEWDVPYECPTDFSHFISFSTGAGIQLMSQEVRMKGLNLVAGIFTEADKGKRDKWEEDVLLSLRGLKPKFGDNRYYRSTLKDANMPKTKTGRWILHECDEYAEQADAQAFFASSMVNIEHLGIDYILDLKKRLLPNVFRTDVKNERLKLVTDLFYPDLNESHYYLSTNTQYYQKLYENALSQDFTPTDIDWGDTCAGDADLIASQGIDVACDFGLDTFMVCSQLNRKELHRRFIKDFIVQHPLYIGDIVKNFCAYYAPHRTKRVRLFPDPRGHDRQAGSKFSRIEEMKQAFRDNRWSVQYVSNEKHNAYQYENFERAKAVLSSESKLTYSFNEANCAYTINSMELAPAEERMIRGKTRICKVKTSEKKKRAGALKPQDATDLSDCFDLTAKADEKLYIKTDNYVMAVI